MNDTIYKKILFGTIFLFIFIFNSFGSEYTIGYGLVFSLNELNANKLSTDLSNISAGGHSSYFYIEKNLNDYFTLSMSPGAMNFEDNSSQFHVQYNIISTNFKMNTKIFPIIGVGMGGCIATLTEGSGDLGQVQNGYFIRNSTFLWMGRVGLGYRISERVELILEGRAIGFFDLKFQNLNSYNVGFALGYKL